VCCKAAAHAGRRGCAAWSTGRAGWQWLAARGGARWTAEGIGFQQGWSNTLLRALTHRLCCRAGVDEEEGASGSGDEEGDEGEEGSSSGGEERDADGRSALEVRRMKQAAGNHPLQDTFRCGAPRHWLTHGGVLQGLRVAGCALLWEGGRCCVGQGAHCCGRVGAAVWGRVRTAVGGWALLCGAGCAPLCEGGRCCVG